MDVVLCVMQHAPGARPELEVQEALSQGGRVGEALEDRIHEASVAQVLKTSTLQKQFIGDDRTSHAQRAM